MFTRVGVDRIDRNKSLDKHLKLLEVAHLILQGTLAEMGEDD